MKILTLADEPSKYLWDFYDETKLRDYDLILSAGDLPPQYLSFIETFSNVPLLYVHGNHDEKYEYNPPEGCECIEDKIYNFNGVRILGLGGSMRYRPGSCQYTEKEMEKRIKHLRVQLFLKGGFDILLTHAPCKGMGDMPDPCHQGFNAFYSLLDKYSPKYMVHGHVHMNYGKKVDREQTYKDTTIVNAYERYVLEI